MNDPMQELVALLKELAATRERMAGAYLKIARVLAADSRRLADFARPADAAEAAFIQDAKERALRILGDLGDDERAN